MSPISSPFQPLSLSVFTSLYKYIESAIQSWWSTVFSLQIFGFSGLIFSGSVYSVPTCSIFCVDVITEKTKMNGDPSSPDLYCHEDPSFLYEDDEEMAEVNVVVNQNEIELEEAHLHSLIDKEIAFGFRRNEDLVIDDWVQEARLQAITWVQTRTRALGFHPRTAYLAITYFDRFISLHVIPEEKRVAFVILIAVACLLLAAKMEEMNRPPLSQYTLKFQGRNIKKMELLVLVVLKWKMNLITPFAFLDNFIAKLCQESPPGLKSGIEKRLLSIMTEIHLMHHRPSAIAAAATLMAVDQNLAQEALEAKITSIPELYFLEIEAVYSYYTMMQVP